MNKEQLLQLSASPRALTLVLLAPLVLAAAFQIVKAGQSLFFHGDNTFPESAAVQTAEWSRQTGRIYPSLDASPYTPAPYGPLFYMGLSAMARLTGANFDQLMIAGRVLVLICFLMLPVIAYRWVRRQGASATVAWIAAAIVLAQIDFLDWNATVRPDLVALVFTFAAFYLITAKELSWRTLFIAGVLCGVAALVKQSFIALPFVTVVWLLTARRIRQAALFASGGIATAIVVLGYLGLRHEPFLQEVLLARYSPVSALAGMQLLKADLLHYPWQIVFGMLACLGAIWIPRKNPLRRLLFLYMVFAWLAGFYTAMAPGANVNAFLEAWVLSAVLAALALSHVMESWAAAALSRRALALSLWIVASLFSLNAWHIPIMSRSTTMYSELAKLARGHRVLSDFPYVTAHGVQPELLDPSVNHYLELAKHWSPQPLLEEIKMRQFDFVIVGLSDGRPRQWRGLTLFSDSILHEISVDYHLACVSPRFAVYVPDNRVVLDLMDEGRLQALGCNAASRNLISH